MRISIKNLRKIISETILLEGQLQDLLDKSPKLKVAYEKGIKKIHYLQWLDRMEVNERIEDMIGLVKAFDQKQKSLKDNGFPTDINAYESSGVLRMTLDKLDKSKVNKKLNPEETDILGKFGDWMVVMPHTRESSCQLGKDTTWCTAATQSQNLFYSYVGTRDEDIILYYIIKSGVNPRKDPTAKLSVGFENGEPDLTGKDGDLTVDAKNKGLTERRLQDILGDQFDPIMAAMKNHSASIRGKHPAKAKMKIIAKDLIELEKVLKGLKEEDRTDFIEQILEYETSPEVLIKLSGDEDNWVRANVAANPSTPPEVLIKLSGDEDEDVRKFVAENLLTPPETLLKLAGDEKGIVRSFVAQNILAPPEALIKLSEDEIFYQTRCNVAANHSTPSKVLSKLSGDKSWRVRKHAAENPLTPPEALMKLSGDKSSVVREAVAKHPSTPPAVLIRLSDDKEEWVRKFVALNPSTPPEVLNKLFRFDHDHIRSVVSKNPTYQKYLESQNQLQESWMRITGLLK